MNNNFKPCIDTIRKVIAQNNNSIIVYNHNFNNNELLPSISNLILSGTTPNDVDDVKFLKEIFETADSNMLSDKDFNIMLRKFSQGLPAFLQKTKDVLDTALTIRKKYNKFLQKEKKHKENLPEFAVENDHPEVIKFIHSLTQEYYTFSKAEQYLPKCRQTLKCHSNLPHTLLSTIHIKKRDYITKAGMVKYYRYEYEAEHGKLELKSKEEYLKELLEETSFR